MLAGREIRQAKLPEGCMIVMMERHGKGVLPAVETVLQAGDHMTFLVAEDALKIVHLCMGL